MRLSRGEHLALAHNAGSTCSRGSDYACALAATTVSRLSANARQVNQFALLPCFRGSADACIEFFSSAWIGALTPGFAESVAMQSCFVGDAAQCTTTLEFARQHGANVDVVTKLAADARSCAAGICGACEANTNGQRLWRYPPARIRAVQEVVAQRLGACEHVYPHDTGGPTVVSGYRRLEVGADGVVLPLDSAADSVPTTFQSCLESAYVGLQLGPPEACDAGVAYMPSIFVIN